MNWQVIVLFLALTIITSFWVIVMDPGWFMYMAFECMEPTSVCTGGNKVAFVIMFVFGLWFACSMLAYLWVVWGKFHALPALGTFFERIRRRRETVDQTKM
jgi:hypothetical protein